MRTIEKIIAVAILAAGASATVHAHQSFEQHDFGQQGHAVHGAHYRGVTGGPAWAPSPPMPRAIARTIRQERRIQQGIRTGQLSAHEVARLERGQARTRSMIAHAGRDGVVTPRERIGIERMQNHQSRRIAVARHNERVR